MAGDGEAAGFRKAVEAFLAVEVMFHEEAAISLEVKEVFPAVAAVSLAVAVSPGAAAAFLVAVVAAFPGATIVSPAEAAVVPLDRTTAFRTILHCSPISADRGRVAVECHRAQREVNQAAIVH